jgi:hypothetical protein
MKTERSMWPLPGLSSAVCFLLSVACIGHAQTSTQVPTVTIQATDPFATWSGNPGVFTVFRQGNPVPALNVYYQISGTASNGVDYQRIGNFVSIPSGAYSNNIVIMPMGSSVSLTKTVTLTLTNSPMMGPVGGANPVNYGIGSPSSATVVIATGVRTNIPPVVAIAYPADGAVFYTPLNLPIVACAYDLDGIVKQVEFFANNVSLGVVTNSLRILPASVGATSSALPMPPYNPFVLVWSNVPPGTNVLLTTRATDNDGASTLSAPVSITVHPGPPPTPTNLPPVVRITSPPDGATFRAPVNIPIYAYAADRDGSVTGGEFFAGSTDLGPGHPVAAVPPPLPPGPIQPPILIVTPNYWEFLWTNPPQGPYALTAVATDNKGASTVSDPVNITIVGPLPPPTNRMPIVSISAIDPIAIEGTNCWPWLGLAGATPTWANWTAATSVCRYFTNCGPKNAIFAVRRLGPTNDDLAVTYDIGGTATNGVDYVTLSNAVTIPAGSYAALITVVPLDDGPPDITSTVILKLTPSSAYTLGCPQSAAAIILDGLEPSPVATVLPDKTFHVNTTGPNGAWFHIEYTTDLIHWIPICSGTNQVFGGGLNFVDPDAPNNQLRFYRAVSEDNAAPQ